MYKILACFLAALALAACDKSKNTIKPIIDFTPRLYKEVALTDVAVPESAMVTNWPGVNFPNELPSNFAIDEAAFVFHKSKMKLSAEIAAAPVIKDDVLFVLDRKNNVTCYDLHLQAKRWQTSLNSNSQAFNVRSGGVTFNNNRLYIVNGSQELIVLEADTGYQLSRLKLGDIVLNPVTLDASNIYLLTAGNQIIALNKDTLSVLWQVSGAQSSLSLSLQSLTQPIVLGKEVLVAIYSGQLLSFEANTGQLKWQGAVSDNAELSDLSYANLSSQPIIDAGGVYAPRSSGQLTKIDLSSGRAFWRKKAQDILSINKFGDLLVVTTNAQDVAALSAVDGQVYWVFNPAHEGKGYIKPYNLLTPLMINGSIYVFSTKGELYKMSLEGNLLATLKIPDNVKFYAANRDNLYLFSGQNVWLNKKAK